MPQTDNVKITKTLKYTWISIIFWIPILRPHYVTPIHRYKNKWKRRKNMVMMVGLVKIESLLWENKRVKVRKERKGKGRRIPDNHSNSCSCRMGKLACASCCSASLLAFRFHFLRPSHYSPFNPIPFPSSSLFSLQTLLATITSQTENSFFFTFPQPGVYDLLFIL